MVLVVSQQPDLPFRLFNFLGVPLAFHSYSGEALATFASIYGRFEVRDTQPDDAFVSSALHIRLKAGTGGGPPTLEIGEKTVALRSEDLPAEFYFFLMQYLIEQVSSHFIMHGGVVERNGRGIIVTGSSSAGKSTLTLALAKRGFAFLSDELAPIRRDNGLIEPFPRRIGIRKDGTEFKELVDIAEVPNGRLGSACRPGWIFFLGPMADPGEGGTDRVVEIAFDAVDENLLAGLRRMSVTREVTKLEDRHYPMLRLELGAGPFASELDSLCRQLGRSVLHYGLGATDAPDFTATPTLQPIAGIKAMMEAARQVFNGRPPARLAEEFGGSETRLVMELAGTLGSIPMFRLTPGKLDLMVDLVEEVTR